MKTIPELQTQLEMLNSIKAIMRDTENNRWQNSEIYTAMNQALDRWGSRVRVPFLYTITGGWQSGSYEYSLPSFIRPPLDVQQRRYTGVNIGSITLDLDQGSSTWVDVPAYHLEPNGTGGHTLRLGHLPYTVEGRVVWWASNGRVPTTVPTLSAAITTTTATTLALNGAPLLGDAGFVKIGQEWMSYAGISQTATITTLSNLGRGLNGTTAATHLISTSCYWGIAAHRSDLYTQLQDQARAYLFSLFLTDASPQETEHHTFQMRYWQQMADEFWKRYTPNRAMKFKLSREGLPG